MKFRPNTTISERQLCLALATTGRMISLNELSAWRKDGLLPQMASTGLGAGKGKSYYWDEVGIVAQAQAVYDAIHRHGRPDRALISLFLSGFSVPLARLRRAWQYQAKMRKPPVVRRVPKMPDTGILQDMGVGRLLLQAAFCVGAAVETGDAHQRAATIALLDRALLKLRLTREGVNDTDRAEQLWQLLNIIASILNNSDLICEAGDDELIVAQRHLGVAMEFLSGCSELSEPFAEQLRPQIFLFLLTLLRSGQADILDRIVTYVEGASWQAVLPPARNRSHLLLHP